MTKPNLPGQNPLPDSEQTDNYPELLDKILCGCPGGAQLQAITLPSATINMGDIISDITSSLSTYTASYGIIVAVIKMISCIIDVICALVNPFSLIFAIIRLFSSCLPDFLSIFPQLAVPIIIICILKIVLAIIEYILEYIIPLIEEIIENINMLVEAFATSNGDAQQAVAFKIAALIKELFNIVGILTTLGPLWKMIQAILDAGAGLPCGGGGGSCGGCGGDGTVPALPYSGCEEYPGQTLDDSGSRECPQVIKNESVEGNDGTIYLRFGSDGPFSYSLKFYSPSKANDFKCLRNFFPKGVDYEDLGLENSPYKLITPSPGGSTFIVTGADSAGFLNIIQLKEEQLTDGYLSTKENPYPGVVVDASGEEIRFGTDTENSFSSSLVAGPYWRYLEIEDIRTDDQKYAAANNGTWRITEVYDDQNIKIIREDGESWEGGTLLDPFLGPNGSRNIAWRITPAWPAFGSEQSFKLVINHAELIRHDLISLGCHPHVAAARNGLINRFPNVPDLDSATLGIPDLPDLDEVIEDIGNAMRVPENIDTQYVLDNYNTIKECMEGLEADITDILTDFKDKMIDYVKGLYPRIVDLENSTLDAQPRLQLVGKKVDITLVPLDRDGNKVARGLPQGTVDAEIETSEGTLTTTTEVLDAYGTVTGDFTAELTSPVPIIAEIKGTVAGYYVGDYDAIDAYDLVPRAITVEFIAPSTLRERGYVVTGEGSVEPLGVGHTE